MTDSFAAPPSLVQPKSASFALGPACVCSNRADARCGGAGCDRRADIGRCRHNGDVDHGQDDFQQIMARHGADESDESCLCISPITMAIRWELAQQRDQVGDDIRSRLNSVD